RQPQIDQRQVGALLDRLPRGGAAGRHGDRVPLGAQDLLEVVGEGVVVVDHQDAGGAGVHHHLAPVAGRARCSSSRRRISASGSNGLRNRPAFSRGGSTSGWPVITTTGRPGYRITSRRIASPSGPPGTRRSATAANGRTDGIFSASSTLAACTAVKPFERNTSLRLSESASSSSTSATRPSRRATPSSSRRRGRLGGLERMASSPSARAILRSSSPL